MKSVYRRCLTVSSFLFTLFLTSFTVQAETVYEEGVHYDLIEPAIRVGASDEVIVTEFFWYGCGHCYSFEPMLRTWSDNLPEGAALKESPAIWNDLMGLHARAFYTAEILGVHDLMHPLIFKAMHVDRKRLGSEGQVRDLFIENGVDGADFDKAFNSFGVSSQVRQADARARAAKISGTPSVMVNGKYLVSTKKAGTQAGMLDIARYLVDKELAALQ